MLIGSINPKGDVVNSCKWNVSKKLGLLFYTVLCLCDHSYKCFRLGKPWKLPVSSFEILFSPRYLKRSGYGWISKFGRFLVHTCHRIGTKVIMSKCNWITFIIIRISISSVVIGWKISYFSVIHLSSCYRTVCYRTACYRSSDFVITRMIITDQIGLHSVLFPLLIIPQALFE